MVVDAPSRLSMEKWDLGKDIHHLDNLGVHLLDSKNSVVIVQEVARSSFCGEMNEKKNIKSYSDSNQE